MITTPDRPRFPAGAGGPRSAPGAGPQGRGPRKKQEAV